MTNRKINLKGVQKLTKCFPWTTIFSVIYVCRTRLTKSTQFRFLIHSKLIKRVNYEDIVFPWPVGLYIKSLVEGKNIGKIPLYIYFHHRNFSAWIFYDCLCAVGGSAFSLGGGRGRSDDGVREVYSGAPSNTSNIYWIYYKSYFKISFNCSCHRRLQHTDTVGPPPSTFGISRAFRRQGRRQFTHPPPKADLKQAYLNIESTCENSWQTTCLRRDFFYPSTFFFTVFTGSFESFTLLGFIKRWRCLGWWGEGLIVKLISYTDWLLVWNTKHHKQQDAVN